MQCPAVNRLHLVLTGLLLNLPGLPQVMRKDQLAGLMMCTMLVQTVAAPPLSRIAKQSVRMRNTMLLAGLVPMVAANFIFATASSGAGELLCHMRVGMPRLWSGNDLWFGAERGLRCRPNSPHLLLVVCLRDMLIMSLRLPFDKTCSDCMSRPL